MELNFAKGDGMLPAIVQDYQSHRVLMVGFMNEEAYRKTVETGFVTFFSRTRNKLWTKGETSGHKLVLKSLQTDCDQDAILCIADAQGEGVCHEGYQSCFFRTLVDGEWQLSEEKVYDPAAVYGNK
jgi:phosphoribosyl-AMP cyclohydrolase